MVSKGRTAAETADVLEKLCEALDEKRDFSAAALEPSIRTLAEAAGWKTKELFTAIRVAVTGRTAAPPLFTTMEAIGRETCRRRLRLAVAHLRRTGS
jgi:glutamyl-tRNA synthetase